MKIFKWLVLVLFMCMVAAAAYAERFVPVSTVKVTATDLGSGRVAIPSTVAGQGRLAVQITVESGKTVAFAFGSSTVEASPAGSGASASAHTHIGGTGPLYLMVPATATHVGFMLDGSGSGTVFLTYGYIEK